MYRGVRFSSEWAIMRNALAFGCVLYLIGCGTPAYRQVDAGPNLVVSDHVSVPSTLNVGPTDLSGLPSLDISASMPVASTLEVDSSAFAVPETLNVTTEE